jgi:hypothetical protein
MEPLLSPDEQSMREKILQQEFPFDPKAWEAMQGLLDDQDRTPLPPPPQPHAAPPSGSKPGAGASGRVKWILLLLLLAAGAGSTTLILKNTASRKSNTGTNTPSPGITVEKNSNREQAAHAQQEIFGLPVGSEPVVKNSQSGSTTAAGKPDDGKQSPNTQTDADSPRKVTPPGGKSGSQHAAGMPAQQHSATVIPYQLQAASEPSAGAMGVNTKSVSEGASGETPGQAASVAAQTALEPFQPLALLPGIPTGTLAIPQRADSIIQPVPYQPISESRRERGWIFGANLNAVDYRPLRFSALPQLGYFWRYRLQPRTTLQGELTLKYVAGYDWRAVFLDVVPGGSAQVILENKRLLYVEAPLVVQRAYAPGQSWQIGLKPALILPIAPYGATSTSNFGAPNRNYSSHEGIRYLDMGLVLGWEYRFNPRWALDLRYNQGLFDLTVDNFYRQRETHLNSDIQVSLRHFITKKTKKYEPKTLFPAPPAMR